MRGGIGETFAEHVAVARRLTALVPAVESTATRLIEVFSGGGRLYTFGNGGSAADAQHFAEELVGRFVRERRPLPAQCLAADSSVLTCIANDYTFDDVFARQVEAFVQPTDAVVAFTTSGRSRNVVRGLAAAQDIGATTILLSGGTAAPAKDHATHLLLVPSMSTARIQEMHILLAHVLLDRVDAWAADET